MSHKSLFFPQLSSIPCFHLQLNIAFITPVPLSFHSNFQIRIFPQKMNGPNSHPTFFILRPHRRIHRRFPFSSPWVAQGCLTVHHLHSRNKEISWRMCILGSYPKCHCLHQESTFFVPNIFCLLFIHVDLINKLANTILVWPLNLCYKNATIFWMTLTTT